MKRIAVAVVVATIFSGVLARELPEFLHVCKRNNPNLGECMKSSVENIRPYLVAGLPEYNMPSLEPLILKEVVAAPGTIILRVKNIYVHGASNFTVSRLKANLDKLRFVVELDFPKLFIKGDYDVDGKVILLRLQGSGPITGTFTNCKGLVKLQAEIARGPDGENHLRVVDFKTKIAVAQGQLKLENLFGGDPILGEAINMAINSNFDSFLKELQPSIESAISDIFLKIANSILDQFTYDSLFPLS